MATTYRVVTDGVFPDRRVAEVARALSERFRVPAERWVAVLQTPGFVVKRGLRPAEAAKFDQAFRRAGCRCSVEPEREEAPANAKASSGPAHPDLAWWTTSGPSDAPQPAIAKKGATGARPLSGEWRTRVKARIDARIGSWSEAWRAAPAHQKALTGLLVAGFAIALVAVALLASTSIAERTPAPEPIASANPPTPASLAPTAAVPVITGSWTCLSKGPSGFSIWDTYVFRSDGGFEEHENGVDFEGTYRQERDALVMSVHRALTGRTAFAPKLVIQALIRPLSNGRMQLATVTGGSGDRRTSTCSRNTNRAQR